MTLQALGALAGLTLLVWLLGRPLAGRSAYGEEDAGLRPVAVFAGGFLLLYVLLLLSDAAGLSWRSPGFFALLVGAAAAATLVAGRPSLPRRRHRPRWGETVALGALAAYGVATTMLWNLHGDFVYHWGVKAKKFYLAGGIDFEYLSRPWNAILHPDYPLLPSSLYAVTGSLGGGFDERSAALWSVLFFALALLAARALARRLETTPFAAQGALAAVALLLAMFGIGYRQAGGADWLIAVALLAGAALLVGPASRAADRGLGLLTALAAAAKLEGMVLAALLVGAHLGRRLGRDGLRAGGLPGVVARSALPAAAVVGVWVFFVLRHELFAVSNAGDLRLDRVPAVLVELGRALLVVNWHGLALCLLALPVLFLDRRLRWATAVVAAQALFYLYVYLSTPLDAVELVRTSAPRLAFHLVPTVLILLIAALDRWSVGGRLATGAKDD